MSQLHNMTVNKKANVYFDGKCISHTVINEQGQRKSVGVILPSKLTFNTAAAEIMELVEGECRVRLAGSDQLNTYHGGQSFNVPANSSFEIEVVATLHYVCHFE